MPNTNFISVVGFDSLTSLRVDKKAHEQVPSATEHPLKDSASAKLPPTQVHPSSAFSDNSQQSARNCFVDEQLNVKIGDFGLARNMYEKAYYKLSNCSYLPIQWMAIEAIEKHVFNEKTDVWSFGVTSWEILSYGAIPFADHQSNLLSLLKSGHRLEKPMECDLNLFKLITCCWDELPTKRPSFKQIVFVLNKLKPVIESNKVFRL